MYERSNLPQLKPIILLVDSTTDLLHRINELLRLNRRWVDHLLDVLSLAVGICGRHVNKHFQLLEAFAQLHHLANSQEVHVHGKPAH